MSVNWNYPTTVWIGENRIDDLSLACKELNILNPLFVTDKDLVSLPMTVEIITNLKNSFSKLDIFSDFELSICVKSVFGVLELFIELANIVDNFDLSYPFFTYPSGQSISYNFKLI